MFAPCCNVQTLRLQLTARQIRQQERAARREAQRAAANVHRIGIGANVKNNLPGTLLHDTSLWCDVSS
jgi:hypothetical protein